MLPEDLIEYGLIPEFIGRLPVVSAIHQLSREDLITILTEPRNALSKQFQRFFEFDDIELVFAEESLGAIADKALERETGARGLRSILEETLLDVQFELPSRRDVSKCVVTKETIERGLAPTLVTQAAPAEAPDEATGARGRVGLATPPLRVAHHPAHLPRHPRRHAGRRARNDTDTHATAPNPVGARSLSSRNGSMGRFRSSSCSRPASPRAPFGGRSRAASCIGSTAASTRSGTRASAAEGHFMAAVLACGRARCFRIARPPLISGFA